MAKQIYLNLPIKDLEKTKEFFAKLGLEFNQQFSDENAACLIIGENIYAMLLVEKYFKTFIKKEISDSKKYTEIITALSVESKERVDELVDKAIEAGGRELREPQDHGFMYGRAFEDLDGHIWEVFYMNESKMPKDMKDKTK